MNKIRTRSGRYMTRSQLNAIGYSYAKKNRYKKFSEAYDEVIKEKNWR
jgi:hypothetical protein